MEFNYSMELNPRPVIDPQAPLYASLPGVVIELGGGECVLRAAAGQSHVMTVQVLQALDQCRVFAPLGEHLARLQASLPKVPADGIRRVLDGLLERRLLLSEADFVAGLKGQATSPASMDAPRIFIDADHAPALGWPAGGGIPAELASADWLCLGRDAAGIKNVLAAAATQGIQGIAVDAGAVVAEINRRLALPSEQRRVLTELIGGGKDATPGQDFNLKLLLAAGRKALGLSVGQQSPIRRHPEWQPGLELRPQAEYPLRFDFPDDAKRPEWEAESAAALVSQLGVLGERVGDLLQAGGAFPWTAGGLRGVAIGELPQALEQSWVVAAELGSRGPAASGDREPWFLLDRQSRRQFSAERDRYLNYLEQGRVWAGVRKATLAQRSEREPLAVDARQWLGYAAVAGSDPALGFSVSTRLAEPRSQVLRLPAATQSSAVVAALSIGKAARLPSLNQFIADFLESRLADIHASAPAARLATGAQLLADFAGGSDAHLLEFTAEYLQFLRGTWISALQRVVSDAGKDAPVYWLADLHAIITANGRALVDLGLPTLAGLPAVDSQAALAAALRSALYAESERLRLWPLVWQRAKDWAAADARWFGR